MAAPCEFDPSGDLDPDETSGRESMYSPASSYSTYSREVKYIFDPQVTEEESQDEYPDYSHIGPRNAPYKHHQHHQHNNGNNFLSHTPRTLSAASPHLSDGGGAGNKENRTPNSQHHHHHIHHNRRGNIIHEASGTEEDSIFESPSPSSVQAFQFQNYYKHNYSINNSNIINQDPYHQNLCSPRARSSYDRGPISPGMEEALYSSTSTFTGPSDSANKPSPYGFPPRKSSTMSDHSYFSGTATPSRGSTLPNHCRSPPDRGIYGNSALDDGSLSERHYPPYPSQHHYMAHTKQGYPALYRSSFSGASAYHNAAARAGNLSQPHHSGPLSPRDRLSGARTSDSTEGVRHERLFPVQNSSSHQHQHPQSGHHHPQQPLGNYNSNQCQQSRLPNPPYPHPPRYNHQSHRRRKTWSPPVMKLGPLAASSSAIADTTLTPEGGANLTISNGGGADHRPFYSNDSLLDYLAAEDGSRAHVEQRKAQSLSEDLDVTPPRLAPISGVLAQVSYWLHISGHGYLQQIEKATDRHTCL